MKIKKASIYIIAMFIVVIDQIIKYYIISNFELYQSMNVIDKFFSITYVENNGAAWSILSGGKYILIFLTFISIFLIDKYCLSKTKINKSDTIIYGILYGGIIGNLIDRIFRGVVIDYLDFKIFNYDFPIFNLADICIVLTMMFIVISTLRGDKNENCDNGRKIK